MFLFGKKENHVGCHFIYNETFVAQILFLKYFQSIFVIFKQILLVSQNEVNDFYYVFTKKHEAARWFTASEGGWSLLEGLLTDISKTKSRPMGTAAFCLYDF